MHTVQYSRAVSKSSLYSLCMYYIMYVCADVLVRMRERPASFDLDAALIYSLI